MATNIRQNMVPFLRSAMVQLPSLARLLQQMRKRAVEPVEDRLPPLLLNLLFSGVVLKPTDSVVLSYLIVNTGTKGSGTVNTIENALKVAGASLATKGVTVGGAAIGGAIGSIVPGLGTLIGLGVGALGGWAVGELKGFLNANCDGLIAAEKVNLAYNDMVAKTAHGTFSQTTHHPSTDSAQGCGYNSSYDVTWTIMSH